MQYRTIGNTGIKVSALGFGTMRYQSSENAAEVVKRGFELGMNYFDCGGAYAWKGPQENSELWTGRAIAGRPRESMVISSKTQCRAGDKPHALLQASIGIRNRDEMRLSIENALKRVGVDWFDFYQFWDMSSQEHFECACVGKDAPLRALREARDEGLLRHIGFTSHGQPADIIRWLKEVPDVRTITIYHNFLDRYCEDAVAYAHEHGVGVNIMGPLRGGLLAGRSEAFARHLPELGHLPVQQLALRFLLSNPGITCVLTGANQVSHLEENAAVADKAEPMAPRQREAFIRAFGEFSKGEPLCTGCRYCDGKCPEGLYVYHLMGLYQAAEIFGMDSAEALLKTARSNDYSKPERCTSCGKCVEACPQKLPIPDRIKKLGERMAK